MAIGWVGSDVWDAAADVVSSVWDRVPGSELVDDFTGGPLQDFANTAVGKVILRAIATSVTGGLAPVLGPQLATVAWTIPGVLRGEPWDEAWLLEFNHRAEAAAQQLGGEAGAVFGQQLGAALSRIRSAFPEGSPVTWAAEQLARELAIRVDVAALAIDLVNRGWRQAQGWWNAASGERMPGPELERRGPSLQDVWRAPLVDVAGAALTGHASQILDAFAPNRASRATPTAQASYMDLLGVRHTDAPGFERGAATAPAPEVMPTWAMLTAAGCALGAVAWLWYERRR